MNLAASKFALCFRRLLVLYVLLALALRSLIPVGYMPDFSAEAHGSILPLMFCDGMDHGAMDANMNMDGMDASAMAQMHHHHNHTGHGLCPFGASAIFGMDGLSAPMAAALAFVAVEALRLPETILRTRAIFSNTSPRSPPL